MQNIPISLVFNGSAYCRPSYDAAEVQSSPTYPSFEEEEEKNEIN